VNTDGITTLSCLYPKCEKGRQRMRQTVEDVEDTRTIEQAKRAHGKKPRKASPRGCGARWREHADKAVRTPEKTVVLNTAQLSFGGY
jgi:hypothetical protein